MKSLNPKLGRQSMDSTTTTRAFGMAALLLLSSLPGGADDARTADEIKAWLSGYGPAFNAKDLDRLARFYHPEVTIYEGGGINRGWADYRDHHLGPELQEMQDPKLSHSSVAVQVLDPAGRSAYVTSEYRLQTRIKEREIDAGGLETLVSLRGGEEPGRSGTRTRRAAGARRPARSRRLRRRTEEVRPSSRRSLHARTADRPRAGLILSPDECRDPGTEPSAGYCIP